MNVLGVTFDSKLNWQHLIQLAFKKSKQALQAIRLISNHLTKRELLTIIKSNFYCILYYNAKIWLLHTISPNSKNTIMSVSASPLKICCHVYGPTISLERLNAIINYPTPEQLTK